MQHKATDFETPRCYRNVVTPYTYPHIRGLTLHSLRALRVLCGESSTRETRKAGTSSHLTNANISTTLDTNPCADLEISRSGERIARSKKKMSQNVTKCQAKRDPHASIRPIVRFAPSSSEIPCTRGVHCDREVESKKGHTQLYNNNENATKCNTMRQILKIPVVIVTLALPTLTPMNKA